MGKRRDIREAAVQLLFSADLNPPGALGQGGDAMARHWHLVGGDSGRVRPAVREAAEALATAVLEVRQELDRHIVAYTSNYQIGRIGVVDRNILRLALFEMFHRDDVPPVVAINEAIEIAKRFGSEDSGRFVNGVLDRATRDLARPLRTAAPAAGWPPPRRT